MEEKKDSLLDEAAAVMGAGAVAGPAGAGAAAAMAGVEAIGNVAQQATTQQSMGQYLIAGGGGQAHDNTLGNAMISALNRIAGFKSRL
jgi:hypothetical protein